MSNKDSKKNPKEIEEEAEKTAEDIQEWNKEQEELDEETKNLQKKAWDERGQVHDSVQEGDIGEAEKHLEKEKEYFKKSKSK